VIQKVFMPKLGQTMEEATVEKWAKKEGDTVARGDILLEITTDKATLEVESYVSGVLRKILAKEGEVLPVNAVIALVGEADEALPSEEEIAGMVGKKEEPGAPSAVREAPAERAAPEVEVPAPAPPPGRRFVSPRARRLAKQKKVYLNVISGTGPSGRIVEKDVKSYLERLEGVKATPTAREVAYERGVDLTAVKGTGPGGKIVKDDVLAAAPAVAAPAAMRVELTAMRKIVAERMTFSKTHIPHYYLNIAVDMTECVRLRAKLNETAPAKISYNDFLTRAVALAMLEHPKVNAVWKDEYIEQNPDINIGIAVALEDGLIVPVIRNADRLSLEHVAAASQSLIEKARGKRLTPDEYTGGSITISNLGMFDVESFIPVINPGESLILGVGKIQDAPVVIEGAIHIRSMMYLSLSGDHRAVDGAVAAAFLKRVKELVEDPEKL